MNAVLTTLAVIGGLYLVALLALTCYALGVYRAEQLAERREAAADRLAELQWATWESTW